MDYLLPNSLPTGVFAAAEALDLVGLAHGFAPVCEQKVEFELPFDSGCGLKAQRQNGIVKTWSGPNA